MYDLYWSIADKTLLEDRRSGIDFYRKLLIGFEPGNLIFDIGANYGAKTFMFLSLGARVVAVEPDEANQAILREMFLKYRVTTKPVVVVGQAVSDKSAVETMWIDKPGSALNSFSQKWVEALKSDEQRLGRKVDFARQKTVQMTTLEELVEKHGMPFFVKIDVEGYEISVIRGLKRPVPYLSFEVNLPEFRPEGLQCVELLGRLAAHGRFNYAVDCLDGLVLREWVDASEFLRLLSQCADKSIEVFWKTYRSDGS